MRDVLSVKLNTDGAGKASETNFPIQTIFREKKINAENY